MFADTADEIADEQKALKRDRKRLSIFTKENVAPIVPAQIELAQFRREKKLKMVAYAKQMKETSKMVAKAGEEMMHHTKMRFNCRPETTKFIVLNTIF